MLDPEFVENWRKFNKQYISGREIMKRLGIYMSREMFINKSKMEGNSARYAHNQFSDMTEEEI